MRAPGGRRAGFASTGAEAKKTRPEG